MYARSGCIEPKSIADDRIDDCDIGPLWTQHFSKIGVDVGSKTIVLSLVYMIEDKARVGAAGNHWSDRVSQELRRHRIPPDQFWDVYNKASS
jgi:hypothetical protein